jgi:hypothetical protein
MMAVREGKWKCPACGAVNLGRDMKCSGCGAVRGPNVMFFLEEDAAEVTDQGLLSTAEGGADWHCAFCGTDNRSGVAACRQCGAPREGMKSRETGTVPASAPGAGSAGVAPSGAAPRGAAPAARKAPTRIIAAVAAVVVLLAAAAFVLTRGKEATLTLRGGEWSREIRVERQESVRHEAWRDQVPSDARILRTWQAQRSTEKVLVGTERVKTGTKDMGNGFFSDVFEDRPVYKENPVYGTRAEYEALEWKVIRAASAKGGIADAPTWPDPALAPGEREGARVESAVLSFSSSDPKEAGVAFTYAGAKPGDLASFSVGKDYPVVVRGDKVLSLKREGEK